MKKLYLVIALISLMFAGNTLAQSERVRSYLQLSAMGKTDEVKSALPDLLAEYPDDPGVMLLHATVIEDAKRAVAIYQKIVKNNPKSEWADDALWRIVQFYAVSGDIEQAKAELSKFRELFPTSPFLSPANDIVRTASSVQKNIKKSEPIVKFAPKEDASESKEAKSETKKIDKKTPVHNEYEETAKIKVEEEEEEESQPQHNDLKEIKQDQKENEPAKQFKGFGLQVGIYKSKEAAENEKKKFMQMRFRTEIVEKMIGPEKMYAVVVGNYSTRESANAARANVKQQCDCEPLVLGK